MTEALRAGSPETQTITDPNDELLKWAGEYVTDLGLPWMEGATQPTPAERLAALPHEGFDSDEQRMQIISQIDAVGLPVDNFRSLARKPNDASKGTENHLGSWGISGPEAGQFSLYERLDVERPEERLATIAHEGAHANSPLNPANAELFGGEAERRKAEVLVLRMADQSLLTNKYMTGYHKYLAKQYFNKEISFDLFAEETQAIATELALTNRAKLEQVQTSQHNKLAKMQKNGQVGADYEPVNLLSAKGEDGLMVPDGIDKQLIRLIPNVVNYSQLLTHAGKLKALFYPDKALAVATERFKAQLAALESTARTAWAAEVEQQARDAVAKVMEQFGTEADDGTDKQSSRKKTNDYLQN